MDEATRLIGVCGNSLDPNTIDMEVYCHGDPDNPLSMEGTVKCFKDNIVASGCEVMFADMATQQEQNFRSMCDPDFGEYDNYTDPSSDYHYCDKQEYEELTAACMTDMGENPSVDQINEYCKGDISSPNSFEGTMQCLRDVDAKSKCDLYDHMMAFSGQMEMTCSNPECVAIAGPRLAACDEGLITEETYCDDSREPTSAAGVLACMDLVIEETGCHDFYSKDVDMFRSVIDCHCHNKCSYYDPSVPVSSGPSSDYTTGHFCNDPFYTPRVLRRRS
jgi:hypothetical protein